MPHSWKHSRPSWMVVWATRSHERWVEPGWSSKVPLNPDCSMDLWFYTGGLMWAHKILSACSSATEVIDTLSSQSPALLAWAGTLKQSQRCHNKQSLKCNFCNSSGSPSSTSNAHRAQLKKWLFPCLSLMQVFGAVTWVGLWKEISTTGGQFIPLVSHTYFRMTGLAFRSTYFCLHCKGPCATSSILLESIATRLTAFKSGQMFFTLYVIYNMNQDCVDRV